MSFKGMWRINSIINYINVQEHAMTYKTGSRNTDFITFSLFKIPSLSLYFALNYVTPFRSSF